MTEEQEDRIAKKVTDQMFTRIYKDFGESMFKKVFWIALAVLVALAIKFGIVDLPKIVG